MRAIYLLIGFLLMFRFPIPSTKISALPFLGFALMLFFVLRAEKMESVFKKARAVLLAALPISAALLAIECLLTAGMNGVWLDILYNLMRILTELAEMGAMVFIYIGIKIIGTESETPALEKQSARNMTLMVVYLFVYLVMNLLNIFAPSVFEGFEFVLIWPFILGYVWRAMNIWMAFTVYSKISASKS